MVEDVIRDLAAFWSKGERSQTIAALESAWPDSETSERRGACSLLLEWLWRHDPKSGVYLRPKERKKAPAIRYLLAAVPELQSILCDQADTLRLRPDLDTETRNQLLSLVREVYTPAVSITILRRGSPPADHG